MSLADRGVARVFALDVNRRRALEWSRETSGWEILPFGAVIHDDAFVAPLPVHDLVRAAKADDAWRAVSSRRRTPSSCRPW